MMDITSGSRGMYRTLTLTGQFWQREDMETLEQYVSVSIYANRPWIILDLDRLTFINSLALGILVRLYSRCSDAGGRLILYKPRSSVRDIIEIADLSKFIAIADTPEQLEQCMGITGGGTVAS